MLRCPLCAGFNHVPAPDGFVRCRLCALVFPEGGVPGLRSINTYQVRGGGFVFSNWNNWLFRTTGRGLRSDEHLVHFCPHAVRIFAAKHGLRVTSMATSLPLVGTYAPWRLGRLIQATIGGTGRPAPGPDNRLTLGVMTTPAAWKDTLALCLDMADRAAEAIVILDTGDGKRASACEEELRTALGSAGPMRARVFAHALDGDFAAQRNRIQEASATEWVLQLDSDERLTARAKRLLPAIIDDAGREGWSAVALPRRNVVDNVLSAFYPDVQYRFVRRSVRFTRPVHEYPDLSGLASSVYLSAEIIHTLSGSRLPRREKFYDGIQEGASRPHDTALLRTPMEPGMQLPIIDLPQVRTLPDRVSLGP